jgi:glycerol-3-phosphate dehydrogenase
MQVVEGKLTCVVAASTNLELARDVQALFSQGNMRINLSRDVQGVEVCGALKNVLAIAAGIVEGKQLGSNALAAVVRCTSFIYINPVMPYGNSGAVYNNAELLAHWTLR